MSDPKLKAPFPTDWLVRGRFKAGGCEIPNKCETDKEMPFSLSVIIGKLDRVYLLLSQNCRRILLSGNVND